MNVAANILLVFLRRAVQWTGDKALALTQIRGAASTSPESWQNIAIQYLYGTHECMHDYVNKGKCSLSAMQCKVIRTMSVAKYQRAMERRSMKKEKPAEDQATTELGFSENKKRMLLPVVDFLSKMQTRREINLARQPVPNSSKWHMLKTSRIVGLLKKISVAVKQKKIRNRVRRVFSLVVFVIRFIKYISVISGNTQMLLKKKRNTRLSSDSHVIASSDDKQGKERAFFNLSNFHKIRQVQVPFYIQLILTKPWFARTVKEVETTVQYLEKTRCFTAYPKSFQLMLARVAWYIELPASKVVIRQSHRPLNFYLLLSGSVRIDRLEGSPCEAEGGRFKTLKKLSSQDIFGDDCVTDPFSLRTYTATTEEECGVLNFNMHDYNNMIQKAKVTEVAPEHIQYLWMSDFSPAEPSALGKVESATRINFPSAPAPRIHSDACPDAHHVRPAY
ncbi:cyclic nucleotide-binding domain-containing protein 2-like [Plakobranchus ocellatus]|uniref:Cyclic nucleotide-binding domain-containing protein 2-like n=1 Tax=Plakobranchus ocellatus TaxID=259542 RepID=A0AAV4DFX9_9GAST|nr:cyclic nucleotide-binding domain-containing protein 2-like [Plakobranchus ocellatus]